jgi:dephospho-CoA kinase
MFKNKKIIGIIGKIASGKSFLLKILNDNTDILCIDCDIQVKKIFNKNKRIKFIEKYGLEKFQKTNYPIIKKYILNIIKTSNSKTIAIEGINIKYVFDDIIDVYIEMKAPYKIRKKRALKRGDTLTKFNFFNSIQGED